MKAMCPNCGQKTRGTDCQWCHYPLTASQPVRRKVAEEATGKSGMNALSWMISIVLACILGGLALVYLASGYEFLMVRSDSMSPALNAGDVIVTSPPDAPVNGGEF